MQERKILADIRDWYQTVKLITAALNQNKLTDARYHYALYGSGAYVVHGVEFTDPAHYPSDIDITTSDPMGTLYMLKRFAMDSNIKMTAPHGTSHGSLLVKKIELELQDGKTFQVDVTDANDFGLSSAETVTKDNIRLLSIFETLQSIYRRPQHREKDIIAFRELIKNNIEYLQAILNTEDPDQDPVKVAIRHMVDFFSDAANASNDVLANHEIKKLLPEREAWLLSRNSFLTVRVASENAANNQISNSASASMTQTRLEARLRSLDQRVKRGIK